MAYLDRVLQPGEMVLAQTRLHWITFLPSVALALAAVVLAIWTRLALVNHTLATAAYAIAGLVLLLALFTFLGRMVARQSTEFAVTDRRVVVKRGLVSLHTVEMNLDKVESVDVDLTLLGRIFGFGAVTIHGVGARWDPIVGIADPLGFRNAITTRAPAVAR